MDVQKIDLEVERVMNLVRGFGWEKTEQRLDDPYVTVVIRKKVEVPIKEEPT